MGLFKTEKPPIVHWAPYGDVIPLKCNRCGAVFLTRNIKYVGATTIYYGDDRKMCSSCEGKGHNIVNWLPNKRLYAQM